MKESKRSNLNTDVSSKISIRTNSTQKYCVEEEGINRKRESQLEAPTEYQQNTSKYTSRRWQERDHHKNTQEQNAPQKSERHQRRENVDQKGQKMKFTGWRHCTLAGEAKSWGEFPRGFCTAFRERFYTERKKIFFQFFDVTIRFCFLAFNFLVFNFYF